VATVSLRRLPVYNTVTNKFETTELALDQDGNLVEVDTIVYTSEESDIVSSTKNLPRMESISLISGVTTYTSDFKYVQNSLNVFFNGSNITQDVVDFGEKYFTLDSGYALEIDPNNDTMFITYLEPSKEG
jgi:hypothetical protein